MSLFVAWHSRGEMGTLGHGPEKPAEIPGRLQHVWGVKLGVRWFEQKGRMELSWVGLLKQTRGKASVLGFRHRLLSKLGRGGILALGMTVRHGTCAPPSASLDFTHMAPSLPCVVFLLSSGHQERPSITYVPSFSWWLGLDGNPSHRVARGGGCCGTTVRVTAAGSYVFHA